MESLTEEDTPLIKKEEKLTGQMLKDIDRSSLQLIHGAGIYRDFFTLKKG
ncbi:Hypothetical predicted protein [Paramuricea clavata]|uniref:Uncharacterized protein n=1 Tax=Paramuricea clavata TaxID=317549 RepID=A0A7D9D640_PARCT|nr:Hypothetical predicted protein [Paramuricea clavata]